jgi:hypothetical protein
MGKVGRAFKQASAEEEEEEEEKARAAPCDGPSRQVMPGSTRQVTFVYVRFSIRLSPN